MVINSKQQKSSILKGTVYEYDPMYADTYCVG